MSLDNLHPLDRQAYTDSLLAQYPVIPKEFHERDLFGRVYTADFLERETLVVIPDERQTCECSDDSDDSDDDF
ncbi:hypothetical protein CVT25_003490 [Psilocybe cyanescens]|uniref:Uncharacterized protein n=1 Tax=Psilocybe cyanescens TaxID=93625 RepID=A0A409WMH2_PSICY|nr:hypothetical protein CVT25_003490 [Psilocybe cyanescens]